MDTTQPISDWTRRLYATIDGLDIPRWLDFMAEDATFTFGNQPAVTGKPAIQKAMSEFYAGVQAQHHHVRRLWELEGAVISDAVVTYTRRDGSTASMPALTIFAKRGDVITDISIFEDLAPLNQK